MNADSMAGSIHGDIRRAQDDVRTARVLSEEERPLLNATQKTAELTER